jgi:uncharacterized YigZ family protein
VDFYNTIASPKRAEIKVDNSKFICSLASVSTVDEAKEFLSLIKKEFHDASHNCYAYQLGATALETKFSDDGEPKNTAGKPILFTIRKYKYSDVIAVVTRYYGGKNLGKGGLVRAYSDACSEAFLLCTPKQINITETIRVFTTYEDATKVKMVVDEFSVKTVEFFRDVVEFLADIPISKVEEFRYRIGSNTNNRAGTKIER